MAYIAPEYTGPADSSNPTQGNGDGGDSPRGGGSPTSGCDHTKFTYEKGHPCYQQKDGNSLSDDEWYEQEIVSRPDRYDTNLSKAQWIAWRQHWDEKTKSFKSENVDSEGNPIQGTGFEKPVDCPGGTTKFRENQCLPIDDPRIQASWALEGNGGGGGGGGTAAPKAGPKAAPLGPRALGQLPYTGNLLQDSMAELFNNRAGVFGTGNPYMSGATPRTPAGQDISGLFLPGGGLWWGGTTDLTSALTPFQQTFAAPSTSVPATTTKKNKQNQPGSPVPMTPVAPPVLPRERQPRTQPRKGPLEMALAGLL